MGKQMNRQRLALTGDNQSISAYRLQIIRALLNPSDVTTNIKSSTIY